MNELKMNILKRQKILLIVPFHEKQPLQVLTIICRWSQVIVLGKQIFIGW